MLMHSVVCVANTQCVGESLLTKTIKTMKILYQNSEFVDKLRWTTIRTMKLIAILTLAVIFQLQAEVNSNKFNFNENNINIKLFNNSNSESKIGIKGKVTDLKGESLPGVSVKVKGTNLGTTTDLDGNYSLDVTESNAVLVFTYIGFVTQAVPLNGRTTVSVQLSVANTALNEVVVTALGISREAKSLTYSAQKIDGKELTKATGTTVINGLQGKISGLTITRSGNGAVGCWINRFTAW